MIDDFMLLEDGSKVTPVHFTFADGAGKWWLACVPTLDLEADNKRPAPWQRTNEPRAVTCPLCKRTDTYKDARAHLDAVLARATR